MTLGIKDKDKDMERNIIDKDKDDDFWWLDDVWCAYNYL